MRSTTSSGAWRARLALLVMSFATFALAACSDGDPVTAPSSGPNAPTAVRDLAPAADADSTRITFTIDQRVFVREGYALINGTATCSRAIGEFALGVRVEQKQPGRVLGYGQAERPMTCTTTAPQIWGIYVPVFGGYFDPGKATVTVSVIDGSAGVAKSTETGNRKLLP